jgi:tetratricopeptide (TPR) repeat protein
MRENSRWFGLPCRFALVLMLLAPWGSASQAQWWPTPSSRQHKSAEYLAPNAVNMPAGEPSLGKTRVLHVRCYADRDWRVGGVRWQDRVRVQLEAINRIIEPGLGVRLEPERFERWERTANPGNLRDTLAELEHLDQGTDVDWVFGFVTPIAIATNSIHEIGMARYLGRHLVVRGMSSVDLMAQFNKDFDRLDQSEREELYSKIKAHKEVVVLLHEWAHTSGVLHSSDASRVMNPMYSHNSSTFSAQDMVLFRAGLASRLDAGAASVIDWSRLKLAVEGSSSSEWFTQDRQELLRILGSGPPKSDTPERDPSRPAFPEARARGAWAKEDVEAYNRALVVFNTGKDDEAWKALRPRAELPEAPAELLSLICRLAPLPDLATLGPRLCQRALDRAAADNPVPFLNAAEGALMRQERAQALAHAREALHRAGDSPQQPTTWIWLAKLLRRLDSPTWAEDALAHAGDDASIDEVRADLLRARRIWGLPRGDGHGSPAPDEENAYVNLWRRVMGDLDKGRLKQVRSSLAEGQKRFADVPGLLTLSCEVALIQHELGPATKHCSAALAAMEEQPRAHYLLAHVKLDQGARLAALAPMKRSVELDPRQREPWLELAQLYRALGRGKESTQAMLDADKAAPAAGRSPAK